MPCSSCLLLQTGIVPIPNLRASPIFAPQKNLHSRKTYLKSREAQKRVAASCTLSFSTQPRESSETASSRTLGSKDTWSSSGSPSRSHNDSSYSTPKSGQSSTSTSCVLSNSLASMSIERSDEEKMSINTSNNYRKKRVYYF